MNDVAEKGADRRFTHVTLVHGTWARGLPLLANVMKPDQPARWCSEGSRFRLGLDAILRARGAPFTVSVTNWSGANSIFARDRAARRIAEAIASRASPGQQELIIGHSHGGNVAMRVAELVSRMKVAPPSVVTIATPFLYIEEGSFWRSRWWSEVLAAFFVTAVLYINLVIMAGSPLTVGTSLLLKWVAFPLIALASYGMVRLLSSGPGDWSSRVAESASYRAHDADARILVIRGMEDEAGMALSLGLLGVRLSDLLSTLVNGLWILAAAIGLLAFAFVLILAVVLGLGYLFGGAEPAFVMSLLDSIEAAMPSYYDVAWSLGALVVVTLLAPGIFKISFGRELLLGSATVAVTAHSVPDVHSRIMVKTLSRAKQGNSLLLHSLYDHEECLQIIRLWLLDQSQEPD